ncbi:unnamed protein product, partial [Didymodactylos carnosus]
ALLLSVLKLSKGIQKWTYKESKHTFLIPPELISTQSQSSNNEKTRVTVPIDFCINRINLIRKQQVEKIYQERRQMILQAKIIRQSYDYGWTIGNDIELKNGAFRVVARRQYGQRNDTIRTGFQSNILELFQIF